MENNEKMHTLAKDVDRSMLACTLGSGSLEVLGTPALLAMMEQCASELAQKFVAEGETTVGTGVILSHSAPTLEGRKVAIIAKLIEHTGRHMTFAITAHDEAGEIGSCTHERVVVGSERFMEKAHKRVE